MKFAPNQVEVALHFGVSVGEVRRWKIEGCSELKKPPYSIFGIEEWLKRRALHRAGEDIGNEKGDSVEPEEVIEVSDGAVDDEKRPLNRSEKITIGGAGMATGVALIGILRDLFDVTISDDEPSITSKSEGHEKRRKIEGSIYYVLRFRIGASVLIERNDLLKLGAFIGRNLDAALIGGPHLKEGNLVALMLCSRFEIRDEHLNFMRQSQHFYDIELISGGERVLKSPNVEIFDLHEENFV